MRLATKWLEVIQRWKLFHYNWDHHGRSQLGYLL